MTHRPIARRAALAVVAVLGLACASASRTGAPETTAMETSGMTGTSEAERVVQAQLEAYNRHDIEAFAATYAPDVRAYRYPDQPMLTGIEALRTSYAGFFASAPAVHATVTRRIVQGDFVIDHETVTGLPDGKPMQAVAIYEVRQGRIATVRFIQ